MADKLMQLDPNDILAEDNSRFGLKRFRIDRLAADIVASGGIKVPGEVSPLPKNHESGKSYRLTAGFYRHAALTLLNENGAGLMFPCMVHSIDAPLERRKRQVSENNERENLSPMDRAIAMSLLLGEGMSKLEIRKEFAVPGGRKGLTMQPLSNSSLNMTMSFLSLPNSVQERIHDGRIGVNAAYELVKILKKSPAKFDATLEQIEANRLADIDREEKEEAAFLEEEKKAAAAGEKVAAVVVEFEKVKVEAESAATTLAEALAAETASVEKVAELYKAMKAKGQTDEQAKASKEAYNTALAAAKAQEKVVKEFQKAADAAKKEADALAKKVQTAEEKAQANRDKIAAARAAKAGGAPTPAADAPTSGAAVRKAAAQTGAGSGPVQLNRTDIGKMVDELSLPGSAPKVQEIGKAFKSALAGITTPKQLYVELQKITGEYVAPATRGAAKKK